MPFSLFSYCLTGIQDNHELIRAMVVSYISNNVEQFASICKDAEQYLFTSDMRSLGVWGTEVEILTMATILEIVVYIFTNCGSLN